VIIFPAIDVRGGRCVRLQQGEAARETFFSGDPAAVAARWAADGAEWLHVVNLDGAFGSDAAAGKGAPASGQAIAAILQAVTIPVQLGGGLRDLEAIETALDLGVRRVVLGTLAVRQPEVVAQAVARFGADRVAVGIDARAGRVAVDGWQEGAPVEAVDLARRVESLGVTIVIYTDITRDGMLSGPNLPALRAMATTGMQVVASGGIASLGHVRAVKDVPGVVGAIIGMALYTGALDLPAAIAEEKSGSAAGWRRERGSC
jgi:phosphoribosylformimino-5-aminoimidazole carboxamide ribotide isomerase